MIPDLDSNVTKLMSIGFLLNDIDQLIAEYEIKDSATLAIAKSAISSLCYKATQVYDTALACHLIRNKERIRSCRANVAHHTDTLRGNDALVGFDRVSHDELWQNHFSDSGCINEIKANLINILATQSDIHNAIQEKSMQDKLLPFVLTDKGDYSHRPIINKAAKAIQDCMLCIAGIVVLVSQHQIPPTAIQLKKVIKELLGLRGDQIDYAVEELVINKVIRKSSSNDFLFIENKVVTTHAAREFVEKYDLEAVLKLYEESIDE